jgi:GrpB-like predicted nucleotidyltransferase (UPF0157 family)
MIVITDYDPGWPAEFEAVRLSLLGALGPLALRIDHIGSTSVPGLGAKDVIDVQVTVKELTPGIAELMDKAGFVHLKDTDLDHVPAGEDPDPARWRKFLFNELPGARRANIHVRAMGNPNQRYPLLFRDYLRSHPNSRMTIERIKREIAKRHADDTGAYYDIKDPVYDLVWDAAQDWAERTGWKGY